MAPNDPDRASTQANSVYPTIAGNEGAAGRDRIRDNGTCSRGTATRRVLRAARRLSPQPDEWLPIDQDVGVVEDLLDQVIDGVLSEASRREERLERFDTGPDTELEPS